MKPISTIQLPFRVSPEVSPHPTRCPCCQNATRFQGVDSASVDDSVMTQEVVVPHPTLPWREQDLDYGIHDGGRGSDIGDYTSIYCAECDALLYESD